MSKKTFIIEIEEGENTRWNGQDLRWFLEDACQYVVKKLSIYTIPKVTVQETNLKCFKCGDGNTPLYCLNCAEKVILPKPSNEEIRRIHAAARLAHSAAKPCSCPACNP